MKVPTSIFEAKYKNIKMMKSLAQVMLYARKPSHCLQKFAAKTGSRVASTLPHSFKKAEVFEEFATEVDDEGNKIKVDARPTFAFFLSQATERAIAESGVGKHPGRRKLNFSLPDNLATAMRSVIQGISTGSELEENALRLQRQLQERLPPLDPQMEEEKKREFLKEIISEEPVNLENETLFDEDEQFLKEERKRKVGQKICMEIFNHRPFDFSTPESACLYMMARLIPDYAALVKTFHQLRCALPHFQPTTLLDFGSGVGSVTWAVDATWPKACKEVVNVDSSNAMHELHELLLKGGVANRPLPRRQNSTHFRHFMPLTGSIKHSLVVSSRSFLELSSRDMRLKTLDLLWKTVMPGGCLVLVENGRASAGCSIMLEAREFILRGQERDPQSGRTRGIIVAPCPHQMKCPLMRKPPKHRICSDAQNYVAINDPLNHRDIFSYLIVQKPTESGKNDDNSKYWPRVVQPVVKSNPVLVRVCNKYGNLQELAASKQKHGTKCLQVAKKCEIGDLYPVEVLDPSQHLNPGFNKLDLINAEKVSANTTENIQDPFL